jgi:hypothetical protein
MPDEHPFKLRGDEYWTAPFKHQSELLFSTVGEMKKAIVIDAPPAVEIGVRDTLPVPLVYSTSMEDAESFAFDQNAVLVAVRLDDGAALTRAAVDRLTQDEAPGGGRGDPDTFVGRTALVDLLERFTLPAKPANYLLTVVLRDLVSNRVTTKLVRSASTYADPEVEKFLREQPLPLPAPPGPLPLPGAQLPAYTKGADSPPVPAEPGIALAVPRLVVPRRQRSAVLTGSFRAAVPRRETTWRKGMPPIPSGQPTAIVPITILLVNTANEPPAQISLRVPSFDPVDPEAERPVVTGHFAVDLLGLPDVGVRAATHFVYAFAGEAMAGPTPMAIVTEDMLPS